MLYRNGYEQSEYLVLDPTIVDVSILPLLTSAVITFV